MSGIFLSGEEVAEEVDKSPDGEDREEDEDAVEEAFFGKVGEVVVAFAGGAHVENDTVDKYEE